MSNRPETNAEWALWYVRHGYAPVPVMPGTKATYVKWNHTDLPEVTEEHVISWWEKWPDASIAILSGRRSGGLVSIDCDEHHEDGRDESGERTKLEWERGHGELPETLSFISGSGGVQYLYRTDADIRNSTDNTEGRRLSVDIRGEGGLFVVPPSVHPNGNRYEWQDWPWDVEPAEADDNVLRFIEYVQRESKADASKKTEDGRGHASFELPEVINKGSRHSTLVAYAASLRAKGYHDDVLRSCLLVANKERCKPPYSTEELEKIVSYYCDKKPGYDGRGDFKGDDILSEEEIIELCKESYVFVKLWGGDQKGYKTRVTAMRALMAAIAPYTDRDADKTVSVFMKSKLYDSDEDSPDVLRAIAKEACKSVKCVYDRDLGLTPIATAKGVFRKPSKPFWDANMVIRYNMLADVIRTDLHARFIDGAPAYWDGRWVFSRRAIEQATFIFTEDLSNNGRKEVAGHITDNMQKALMTDSDADYDGEVYVQLLNGTYRVNASAGIEEVEPDPSMLIVGRMEARLHNPGPNKMDEFLDGITCGDRAVRARLEEMVGLCMTGSTVIAKSFVLQGEAGIGNAEDASNGKSTFIKVLKAMLGSANCTSITPKTLGKQFQAASIIGKTAILADEMAPDALSGKDNTTFKQIVAGFVLHTDVKFKDGIDFKPMGTVVMSLNKTLEYDGSDQGLKRRLAFIPFRAVFHEGTSDCNPNLKDELCRSRDAIDRLAWLGMQGLLRVVRTHRLTYVRGADEMLESARLDRDPVAAWVAMDSIEWEDISGRATSLVYEQFRKWCTSNGWSGRKEDGIPVSSEFSKKLGKEALVVRSAARAIELGIEPNAPAKWRIGTKVKHPREMGKPSSVRVYSILSA